MNAISAAARTPTTVAMACPWCDEPVAVEDAFAASAVRCPACSTSVDFGSFIDAASEAIRIAA